MNVAGTNKLRDGTAGNTYIEYSLANGQKVDARQHGDSLQNYRYYMKPHTYQNNHTNNFGWAFHMRAVINSDANKAALLCETSGGNARGYDVKYKAKANDAAVHATGATSYYCDYKMWEGAVATMYDIRVRQMPDIDCITILLVNMSMSPTAISFIYCPCKWNNLQLSKHKSCWKKIQTKI